MICGGLVEKHDGLQLGGEIRFDVTDRMIPSCELVVYDKSSSNVGKPSFLKFFVEQSCTVQFLACCFSSLALKISVRLG